MGGKVPFKCPQLVTSESPSSLWPWVTPTVKSSFVTSTLNFSLKDPVPAFGPAMVKKRQPLLAWSVCLKEMVVSPLHWHGGWPLCRMRYCLPHLPTLKEKEFQDVPGHSAVLRVVCIPLCSPAWHLTWLSHPPPEHLTTPSGLQMEINRALEKCALKWPLLSD